MLKTTIQFWLWITTGCYNTFTVLSLFYIKVLKPVIKSVVNILFDEYTEYI